ncbi:LysM peptidoglycan-binding domain-containing protein [Salinicoccus sp. ID82-1]|uniref:LysM peptidoglycan-binding domain-containing protein n=1 Tax=Salinicoccus sp. ID82-1 TaxID=2820269 RepID=UPI001F3B9227|nr:LysM peptidoglycan-binding domain-containing protein [Salinicoccus sp. ID82-1]MCG1009078.1 LysM peptidoglycan-binding domain-containing protein [Salinicoccus sp. ID82-1]
MKDDFYKDIEHKRASKEEKDKKTRQQSEEQKTPDRNFSRAERHRPKEKDKGRPKSQQNERLKAWRQKIDENVNKEKLEKGKALFAGKLSAYSRRVKDELKVSKEKLSEVRPARKQAEKTDDDGGRRGFAPTLIAGILILPVTIILGVLIISNFWPTEDPGAMVADNAEESNEEASEETVEESSEEVNEDLQDQKAELERELAESRDETGGNDLATGSVEFEYSEEEQSELEAAASTAIEDKASGEAADSSTSVVEAPEESTEEAEVATEETPEESTEEAPETSGGTTHVIREGENVYRIAMRYYGSGSAENVSKILEANGVDANSLSVGQELVIPE